ncbi:hypothetical protein LTR27_009919 [Elasticomyces elasticus]|nr:hypothetical protein LTR27_009919 [Elasticomyces elasticus]
MDSDLPPDDGLKWFGEGFDGFPKRLPDDCVEYVIYVIDKKLENLAATRSRLKEILKVANEICQKHTKNYIWQRDAFQLKLRPSLDDPELATTKSQAITPHLRGRTDFGDSVADEWLVVYLLRELSRQCPEIWIRVYDTDGEFLLIEAANSLPKWLNPEIAENRVWINDGRLRIIPLLDSDSLRSLSLEEALEFIRDSREKVMTSQAIEDEAFYRLKGYPAAIAESLHHSLITIPRRLAYLLHRNPAYISAAVEAFYLRDPVSLKPLATKDLSTLTFPPEDFVEVSVRFTKVLFAQLRSQVFEPPGAWTGIIPRLGEGDVGEKLGMGMKLTCGFEMLLADKQNQDKKVVREMKILLSDIDSGDEPLPTDVEIQSWPRVEDDEKWLDIDYNDFEDELAGKNAKGKGKGSAGGSGDGEGGKGFGDKGAQDNLRKMVSRFEDFLNDDDAGAEGVNDDDEDDDEDSDSVSGDGSEGSGEDKEGSFEEAEFERAMREMMGMPGNMIEERGLLDEARKLALADEEEGESEDEGEEMRKVVELMERELKGHGALNIDQDEEGDGVEAKGKGKGKAKDVQKPAAEKGVERKVMFGPERPPDMQAQVQDDDSEVEIVDDDDDVGPGDGELSSDDEEHNQIDLGLAKNMLEAFKGQAGMQGPAGNLMRALGVQMPRDEDGGPA